MFINAKKRKAGNSIWGNIDPQGVYGIESNEVGNQSDVLERFVGAVGRKNDVFESRY